MAPNGSQQLEDIAKIASGGELSRFMLALKVVLANLKSVTTVIFDEIDTGIGGFIAEIVGERLKKLGQQLQVLVVTHLPQVASKGSHHLRVIKKMMSGYPYTLVEKLDEIGRREEIAKMLSGETVTEEALMAASKLLQS
jgi:DNA repair protein RecN (Recombination protein N)